MAGLYFRLLREGGTLHRRTSWACSMRAFRSLVGASALLLLTAALLPAGAANVAAEADIVTALAVRAEVRDHTLACEQIAGDVAWRFKWEEYFWEGSNLAAFRVADAIVASQSSSERKKLDSIVDDAATRLGRSRKAASLVSHGGSDAASCRELRRQFADYPHRHDLLGPGVFQHLERLYEQRQGSTEMVRREVQHEDMVIGCAMKNLNSGRHDFESVHGLCVCTMGAIITSATPAELDAYLDSASAAYLDSAMREDNAAAAEMLKQQPWIQQAMPKLKACIATAR